MATGYYESDAVLNEYLLFHYGKREDILSFADGPRNALDFHARAVQLLIRHTMPGSLGRALDLGCAVGRGSFELARFCFEVVGIDSSGRFIEAAGRMKEAGRLTAFKKMEGDIAEPVELSLPADIDRRRVEFRQADAQCLPQDLGTFDMVLVANLIDRLSHPANCLRQLSSLINDGGTMLMCSPYTWSREFTPVEHWVGGFEQDAVPVWTIDGLSALLSGHFELLVCRDLPFLIREHARKYQWSVAHASLWKKRKEQ